MQNPTQRVAPSHLFALVTGHGVIRPGCRTHSAIPACGSVHANRAAPRRNPNRRQRAVALQTVHSSRIQLIAHVDRPHHQVALRRCASRGTNLACSILSTFQYQFPAASTTTSVPGSQPRRYSRTARGARSSRWQVLFPVEWSSRSTQEYRLCESNSRYTYSCATPFWKGFPNHSVPL
jgi:hypothetical protein